MCVDLDIDGDLKYKYFSTSLVYPSIPLQFVMS